WRAGVIPLNDAAERWLHVGIDDMQKRANRRTYGEWLYAICEPPAPVARPWLQPSQEAHDRAASFLRAQAPRAHRFICFNTGASQRWQEKRWKMQHYHDFGRSLGADSETAIFLVGGPDEVELNRCLLA